MEKDADAYRTISEVSDALDIPAHVLRFWETKFAQIKPLKRAGGRRYYRRADIELLRAIRRLLYEDAYTIRGVQRLLKQQGASAVAALPPEAVPPLQPEDLGPVDAPGLGHLADRSASALATALAAEITACRDLVAASFGARPEAAPEA